MDSQNSTDPGPLISIKLTSLFTNTLLIAYAVPLLLISILFAFAGTFLTLDRTSSFPPRSDAVEPIPGEYYYDTRKKKFIWIFEGGCGGTAGGYLFGLHASTFLALVIMNKTDSAPLSQTAFLVVWLLSSLITAVLAARWKYVALTLIGLTGGATFSAALCIILHPSIPARIVLLCVLTSLMTLACLLPIEQTRHCSVRLATSIAGALGIAFAIALLAHVPSWSSVWERFWISSQADWDTGQEKGMDAVFFFLLLGGFASDYFLRKYFGEDPDEQWDTYLAKMQKSLTNNHDRAGAFQPLTSFWNRLFKTYDKDEIQFFSPEDLARVRKKALEEADYSQREFKKSTASFDLDDAPARSLLWKEKRSPTPTPTKQVSHGFTFLNKAARLEKRRERRKPPRASSSRTKIEFEPLDGYSSESSEAELDSILHLRRTREWALNRAESLNSDKTLRAPLVGENSSNKSSTKLDVDIEMAKLNELKSRKLDARPEYSDVEEDITAVGSNGSERNKPGWKPGFLNRYYSIDKGKAKDVEPPVTPPPGAVPVTPSLMNAINRVAAAQKEAYEARPQSAKVETPGLPPTTFPDEPTLQWDSFWKDVETIVSQRKGNR